AYPLGVITRTLLGSDHQHAAMLRLAFWLDVDDDLGTGDFSFQCTLDTVADAVRIGDRHFARHDQMEIDERRTPSRARANVVGFDGALGTPGDDSAYAPADLAIDSLVHEAADR